MLYEFNAERDMEEREWYENTTRHGLERTMERAGLKKEKALRMIRLAWERGQRLCDLDSGWQRYYRRFDRQAFNGPTQMRFYNGFVFIFNSYGTLITMLNEHERHGRKRLYDGKVRVRDARKYGRMNHMTDCGAELAA